MNKLNTDVSVDQCENGDNHVAKSSRWGWKTWLEAIFYFAVIFGFVCYRSGGLPVFMNTNEDVTDVILLGVCLSIVIGLVVGGWWLFSRNSRPKGQTE